MVTHSDERRRDAGAAVGTGGKAPLAAGPQARSGVRVGGGQGRRGPMLLPLACLHGRVAQCLTSLLVLAEPLPRPRRNAKARSAGPTCTEAAPVGVKMAAELYPPASASAATATDIANSNAADAAVSRKVGLCCPPCPAPAPLPPLPAPPLPDNNNPESPNWQSFHPTLRER